MGFNRVYRSLAELFPQIDSRILKAVAIEHSKDVDAAAEVVLSEVLPLYSQSFTVANPPSVNDPPPQSQISAENFDEDGELENNQLRRRRLGLRNCSNSSSGSSSSTRVRGSGIAIASTSHTGPPFVNEIMDEALDGGESCFPGYTGQEELMFLGKGPEKDADVRVPIEDLNLISNDSMHGDSGKVDIWNAESETGKLDDTDVSRDHDITAADFIEASREPSVSVQEKHDRNSIDLNNVTREWADSQHHNLDVAHHDGSFLEDSHSNIIGVGGGKAVCHPVTSNPQKNVSDSTSSHSDIYCGQSNSDNEKPDCVRDENDPALNSVITRSGSVCSIELPKDIIEDAKSNKKTLFAAMELVVNMMREVEHKEKAAEQAQEEAARGGSDILKRVDELKQMLTHAKEANDMHAGEVYGEKAILATEAKELQNRLLSLAEERDKSLAILDEMRGSLEARLAVAEELRKAAEQEKLEKEELARKALAEQEAIMEKLVQDSKILQQEAAENSKLREFLMDRGRVVDVLQGEIVVICQDVRMLKEKFDDRIPLSKSISSSQTSCILASSGSSGKSTPMDLVMEPRDIPEVSDEGSPAALVNAESSRSIITKELLDDGWDIFDKEPEL